MLALCAEGARLGSADFMFSVSTSDSAARAITPGSFPVGPELPMGLVNRARNFSGTLSFIKRLRNRAALDRLPIRPTKSALFCVSSACHKV